MRINFENSLKTVTVFNRLDGRDSASKKDTWHKTVLHGVQFDKKSTIGQSGTETVMTQVFKIQLPDFTDYLSYREWMKTPGDKWTLSLNDYIILGEVLEDTESVRIEDIARLYAPDVCQVKVVKDTRNDGIISGRGGVKDFIECLYVEGL